MNACMHNGHCITVLPKKYQIKQCCWFFRRWVDNLHHQPDTHFALSRPLIRVRTKQQFVRHFALVSKISRLPCISTNIALGDGFLKLCPPTFSEPSLSLSSEPLNFCQVPFPLIHFTIEWEWWIEILTLSLTFTYLFICIKVIYLDCWFIPLACRCALSLPSTKDAPEMFFFFFSKSTFIFLHILCSFFSALKLPPLGSGRLWKTSSCPRSISL